jgi:excisionase family DNA binding protein
VFFVTEKAYTTREAAKAVGITRVTLQAWIAKGKLKAPQMRIVDGRAVRLWTASDMAALRRVKAKVYMKQMGRPKKSAKR